MLHKEVIMTKICSIICSFSISSDRVDGFFFRNEHNFHENYSEVISHLNYFF